MSKSVLVINCGSSSIKFALLLEEQNFRIHGLAENLGTENARIKGVTVGNEPVDIHIPFADHKKALEVGLERLANYRPDAIGHRVVHGGSLTKAELINDEIIEKIREATPLAPLHNPAHLIGIEATKRLFPELPQVAVLILPSTKPCQRMLIVMPCRNFYILLMVYVAMVSTEPAMPMFQTVVLNWQAASNKAAG